MMGVVGMVEVRAIDFFAGKCVVLVIAMIMCLIVHHVSVSSIPTCYQPISEDSSASTPLDEGLVFP